MLRVSLQDPIDLAAFRAQARGLLAAHVRPGDVLWQPAHDSDLFADAAADGEPDAQDEGPAVRAPAVQVPAEFIALCRVVILHNDPQRHALLYRLLWRLVHDAALRHDPLDADMLQAQHMGRAVRRDMHKMRAFVRFTQVADGQGGLRHVAWFEPEHHIALANAPFFVRRFAQMRWSILTPECSLAWDGQALSVGAGALARDKPPADAGEALWLTYYANIFNPARLKLAMMKREMPVRYWRHLPEAALIQPLVGDAHARSQAMIDAPATPARRIRELPALRPHATTAPSSLPELNAATQACRACPLGAAATQAVHGEGPPTPRHMLVGEQPGDLEDLRGRPFIGPAGRLLDRALAQLGWPRDTVYLTNAVRHFKHELRGKRRIHKTPGQLEALQCAGWLEHEIALVQPQLLVALGATAARALLGRSVAVASERGHWIHERADGRPVLVTLHPAALLRMDGEVRDAAWDQWLQDLQSARAVVSQGSPDAPSPRIDWITPLRLPGPTAADSPV